MSRKRYDIVFPGLISSAALFTVDLAWLLRSKGQLLPHREYSKLLQCKPIQCTHFITITVMFYYVWTLICFGPYWFITSGYINCCCIKQLLSNIWPHAFVGELMGFFRAVMCSGENWYTDIRFKDSDRLFKIQSSVTCLASKFSEW